MNKHNLTLKDFANIIHTLLRSDRDVNVGVGGFTGEGKSAFSTLLQKEYSKISGTHWDFSRMTWSRKELMQWIDGKKNKNSGKREGQLPEYSAILPDELFAMFYRRNWFNEEQIDAISTFNMCRDRHIFLCGNIPNFWELDTGFTSRIRFYVYIPKRGIAWVFQQENNPFCNDNWNARENKKIFRKKKNPYSIPNFIGEIYYPDWTPEEKEEYYTIRNKKRLTAIDSNKSAKVERYANIKRQRDELIRLVYCLKDNLTLGDVADVVGMSKESIRLIKEGLR